MYYVHMFEYAVRSTSVLCSSDRLHGIISIDIGIYKVPAVLICTCRYKVQVHQTYYTLSFFMICICV